MRDPKLGRRYAEALYGAAREQGTLEEVHQVVRELLVPLTEERTFQAFWRGYGIPLEKKLELIEELFKEAPAALRQFLRLLLEKKREDVLLDVLPAFTEIVDRESGVVRAVLKTAIELEEAELTPFKELLAKRTGSSDVELRHQVDTSLIAGFRLQYGDKVIDASVARTLLELRRRLSA